MGSTIYYHSIGEQLKNELVLEESSSSSPTNNPLTSNGARRSATTRVETHVDAVTFWKKHHKWLLATSPLRQDAENDEDEDDEPESYDDGPKTLSPPTRIDSIQVLDWRGKEHFVDFLYGDITSLSDMEAVDALVVSAFPGDYSPVSGTVLGSLWQNKGISLEALAENKEADMREFSNCWLSSPLVPDNGRVADYVVGFRRILCFEPYLYYQGQSAELVGDVFRSIVPFTAAAATRTAAGDTESSGGNSSMISTIALPILTAGNQGYEPEVMLEALAQAAASWLANGLPLERIKMLPRTAIPS